MWLCERVAVDLPARLRPEDAEGTNVDVWLRVLRLRGTLLEPVGQPPVRVGTRARLTLNLVWATVASGSTSIAATIRHLRALPDGSHGGRP